MLEYNNLEDKPLLFKVELLSSIQEDFPFLHLFPFNFSRNITILTGENGTGKSTFLEALALKLGCPAEGGSINFNYKTDDTHVDFTKHVRLAKSGKKIKDVFFFRSETFYTFLSEMRRLDSDSEGGGKINNYYGGRDLHTLSHGEAMMALVNNRFKGDSLYILDEPEVALSIANQINFIEKLLQLSKKGAQFVIATHSPLLMMMPDADLVQFTNNSKYEINFCDTNNFYILKELFSSEGEFLKKIIDY
ncbi:AAA family ATPase [Acinetobacter baumannii]|nr:AAA family ATPase [Acinetobacter baumannii]